MSRVTWQPSNTQRKSGSVRFCHLWTEASGESPCSKNMNLPPAIASTTPEIVHKLKVLTTGSTLASAKGISSPVGLGTRRPVLFSGVVPHPGVRFQGIELVRSSRIIVNEVHTTTHANLQDISFRQRDYALPNLLDGLWISQKYPQDADRHYPCKRA